MSACDTTVLQPQKLNLLHLNVFCNKTTAPPQKVNLLDLNCKFRRKKCKKTNCRNCRLHFQVQIFIYNLYCSTVPFHICIFDPYVIIYLAHKSSFITGGPCAASALHTEFWDLTPPAPKLRLLRMLKRSKF